jgi:hypothetical protein
MYFFVPYNISPIQQSIQAGHAMGEYCLKYGRHDSNHIIWHFLEKWKTWIVLNGGTTSSTLDIELIPTGSLDQINDSLFKNKIEFSNFYEPDLNNALTAVCFIVDEKVFNKKLYPDFEIDADAEKELIHNNPFNINIPMEEFDKWYSPQIQYNIRYTEWVEKIGEKNVFLRELLKGKRLA